MTSGGIDSERVLSSHSSTDDERVTRAVEIGERGEHCVPCAFRLPRISTEANRADYQNAVTSETPIQI